MSKIKLLPCPFCGGEAEFKHEHDYFSDSYESYIQRKVCGTRTKSIDTGIIIGEMQPMPNPLIIIAKIWNTRKLMDKIVEQLEELTKHDSLNLLEYARLGYKLAIEHTIDIIRADGKE